MVAIVIWLPVVKHMTSGNLWIRAKVHTTLAAWVTVTTKVTTYSSRVHQWTLVEILAETSIPRMFLMINKNPCCLCKDWDKKSSEVTKLVLGKNLWIKKEEWHLKIKFLKILELKVTNQWTHIKDILCRKAKVNNRNTSPKNRKLHHCKHCKKFQKRIKKMWKKVGNKTITIPQQWWFTTFSRIAMSFLIRDKKMMVSHLLNSVPPSKKTRQSQTQINKVPLQIWSLVKTKILEFIAPLGGVILLKNHLKFHGKIKWSKLLKRIHTKEPAHSKM